METQQVTNLISARVTELKEKLSESTASFNASMNNGDYESANKYSNECGRLEASIVELTNIKMRICLG